ncbi:L,D-transpeptidase family protein [Actinoallomurus purpureus]|uniref:L,D-transpeptidase n=1 Tax=Actinoallomurus purpureus TaxID=478114 RepID=UPI0020928B4A|nr:L,D-transpeptidase family protein [Actinoallomurus purpureus]MCO6008217.1 L,D-transpeptidase family protein [Actinoallomurus purpureus]
MSISLAVPGPRWAAAAIGVAVSLSLTGCGGGSAHDAAKSPAANSTAKAADTESVKLGDGPSTIATARPKTVDIFKSPGDASPSMQLSNPNPDGVKRVFLVVGSRPGWVHVLLPVPPNGSEGWIAEKDLITTKTSYWVQVLQSAHRVKVYQGKRVLIDTPAAIGKSDTPTPGGRYYLTELLQAPNPKGAYGPYAYGLSGYSTTLTQFQGQDAIIGIHGTNEPQSLGKSVSHGCVRVGNTVISRMAKMLPLGTPVQINA